MDNVDKERSTIYISTFFQALVVVSVLGLVAFYNYSLFITLSELTIVFIGFGIFAFAWSTRSFIENRFFLFIGIAYFFVSNFDLYHTLIHSQLITVDNEILSLQFRTFARLLESVSFIAAFFLIKKNFRPRLIFLSYAAISLIALISFIYRVDQLAGFLDVLNMIRYESVMTYLAIIFFAVAVVLAIRKRKEFDRQVANFLILALIFKFLSLAFFVHSHDAFSYSGMMRNTLKFISYFLLYKAVIEVGLTKPYRLLFRKLNEARKNLEEKVKIRTSELEIANEQLASDKQKLIDSYQYLGISNRKISVLLDLHHAPVGKNNRQDIIWYIVNSAINYFRAEQGFLLKNEDIKNFSIIYSLNKNQSEGSFMRKKINSEEYTILEELISKRTTSFRICSEKKKDCFNQDGECKHCFTLPLVWRNDLKGAIVLTFRDNRENIGEDMEFLDLFSAHATRALIDAEAMA
jgi:hypothetical protein